MKNSIITLLVVAAAGIIVLVFEYNFFKDGPSSTSSDSDSHISIPLNETISSKPSSVYRSMPQHEKETEAPKSFYTDSLTEKLSKMYDTAKSISYDTSARNKALREVVDLALNYEDSAFATEVAKEISYDTTAKNDALEKIVKHACDNEDFETAKKVADEISFDENRKNQNKQRIMEAMKRTLRKE